MYCSQCGFNAGNAKFCPSCGKQLQSQPQVNIGQQVNQGETINTYFDNAQNKSGEGTSFWWGVLCLIIPIIGIILFFCWREKYPRRAKVCLWCSIVGMIINYFAYPYLEEISFRLIKMLTKS